MNLPDGVKTIDDDSRLYGGEEVYVAAEARKRGYNFGYYPPVVTQHQDNNEREDLYPFWKWYYGFVGSFDGDLSDFMNSPDSIFDCFNRILDFNNDWYLEIVVSKVGEPYETYVLDYQGNVLSGWPQETSWDDYRSPIVGDVNGDGNPDVVNTAGSGTHPSHPGDGGVYAWNIDGSLIDGFPKVTEYDAQAAATIADIDNDGKVDAIASSDWDKDHETDEWKRRSTIYVWELDSSFNEVTMEWPMFHRDTMHTGYYALDLPGLNSFYK